MFKTVSTLFIVCLCLHSCAYSEEVDEFYESKEAIEQSNEPNGFNAFQRGWIPEWIPDSSYDIREAHDLDTNEQILALRYSTDQAWQVPSSCSLVAASEVRPPGIQRPWWPSSLPMGDEIKHDYQIHVCEEGNNSPRPNLSKTYLAIDGEQLFFWKTNKQSKSEHHAKA